MNGPLRAAVVIVLRRGAETLVVRRAGGVRRAGFWALPSGALEPGEDEAAAVVREAREELGLSVRPLARVQASLTDDGGWTLGWWRAEIVGGTLAPDPAEVAEARWVDAAGYAALAPRFEQHLRFLEALAAAP